MFSSSLPQGRGPASGGDAGPQGVFWKQNWGDVHQNAHQSNDRPGRLRRGVRRIRDSTLPEVARSPGRGDGRHLAPQVRPAAPPRGCGLDAKRDERQSGSSSESFLPYLAALPSMSSRARRRLISDPSDQPLPLLLRLLLRPARHIWVAHTMSSEWWRRSFIPCSPRLAAMRNRSPAFHWIRVQRIGSRVPHAISTAGR